MFRLRAFAVTRVPGLLRSNLRNTPQSFHQLFLGPRFSLIRKISTDLSVLCASESKSTRCENARHKMISWEVRIAQTGRLKHCKNSASAFYCDVVSQSIYTTSFATCFPHCCSPAELVNNLVSLTSNPSIFEATETSKLAHLRSVCDTLLFNVSNLNSHQVTSSVHALARLSFTDPALFDAMTTSVDSDGENLFIKYAAINDVATLLYSFASLQYVPPWSFTWSLIEKVSGIKLRSRIGWDVKRWLETTSDIITHLASDTTSTTSRLIRCSCRSARTSSRSIPLTR